jgi:hypothetical protein
MSSYTDKNYGGQTQWTTPTYANSQTFGSNYDHDRLNKRASDSQARAAASAEESRNAQVVRDYKSGENSLSLAGRRDDQNAKSEERSRRLIESIDRSKVDVDNKFRSRESALDRNKSSDEFSQSRYQLKHNQAQDRANLEYSTAQGLAKDKQSQDAELARLRASGGIASALADKTNAANTMLANISQATELAGQSSAIERARLAANAQVKAALFTPRQYSGY